MSEVSANGVRLQCELQGSGEPLVLVHGSWADATDYRAFGTTLEPSNPSLIRVMESLPR